VVAARAVGLISVAAGAAGLAAGKVGASYNQMQDRQRIAFTTFLGSARKARNFMRQLQALALKSPVLDPETTGKGAQQLLAYGVSVKQVLPLVKALGDSSAASGRNISEVLPMASRALGQIQSKGRLQMEELNQLADGPVARADRARPGRVHAAAL
jgi:tape measure domain-containing protein